MNRKLVLLMILTIVVAGMFGVALKVQRIEASETIYINADGSVNPSTANITTTDNITYTFTDHINESIVVLRRNITIDGNGYMLNGTGTGQYAGLTIEYVDPLEYDNVTIQNMTITGFGVGIGLISTEFNKIFGCTITNNNYGIWSAENMNNTISGNNITNNTYGIFFNTVFYTDIFGNNITDNTYGVWLEYSTNNKFYHNYFVDNTNQTYVDQGNANTWDDGYPSGGNYWSNFEERYPDVENIYSGEYPQSEPGSDDFWDGPYEINEDNIDHYPIVPEFPTWTSMLLIIILLTVAIAVYKRRLLKTPIN